MVLVDILVPIRVIPLEEKIGFYDLKEVIQKSDAGKRAGNDFKNYYEKKKAIIADTERDLKSRKADLEKNRPILTEAALKEAESDYQNRLKSYQLLVEITNAELKKIDGKISGQLLPQIMKIVNGIKEKERYTALLDKNVQGMSYSKDRDITSRIIEECNQYPISYSRPEDFSENREVAQAVPAVRSSNSVVAKDNRPSIQNSNSRPGYEQPPNAQPLQTTTSPTLSPVQVKLGQTITVPELGIEIILTKAEVTGGKYPIPRSKVQIMKGEMEFSSGGIDRGGMRPRNRSGKPENDGVLAIIGKVTKGKTEVFWTIDQWITDEKEHRNAKDDMASLSEGREFTLLFNVPKNSRILWLHLGNSVSIDLAPFL